MKTHESKLYDALCTIIELNAECDAIIYLSKSISEKLEKCDSQNSEMKARLRMIKGISENEFIDALCEL